MHISLGTWYAALEESYHTLIARLVFGYCTAIACILSPKLVLSLSLCAWPVHRQYPSPSFPVDSILSNNSYNVLHVLASQQIHTCAS